MKSKTISPIDIKRPQTAIKKIRKPEKPVDTLKTITKQNESYAIQISDLEAKRDSLMNALDDLNDRIIKDADLISGLREKFQDLIKRKSEIKDKSVRDEDIIKPQLSQKAEEALKAFETQSPSKYLSENPLILMDIFSGSSYFAEVAKNIETAMTLGEFLVTSMEQLNAISRCLKAYESLKENVRLTNFLETSTDTIGRSLGFTGTNLLSSAIISKDFYTVLSSTKYFFTLDFDKSFAGLCIKEKKSLIILDPTNDENYCPSIDQILNPTNKPLLVSPIWDIGVLYIPQTSPFKKGFTKADVMVTEFFCQLLAPLLYTHINYDFSIQLANHRRALQIFKTNLVPKSSLTELIPFLYQTIQECICANDVEMYIISDQMFAKVNNEDNVDEEHAPLNGFPQRIVVSKDYYIVDRVNERTPGYFGPIDEWSLGNCFLGYPIISDNAVIATLELSGKTGANKFTQWDVDFVSVICRCLGLILPRCLQVFDKERDENIIKNAAQFSESISEYTFANMTAAQDIYEKVCYDIMKVIRSEYLLIATQAENAPKIIISFKDGEKNDSPFINHEFLSSFLKSNNSINTTDFTQVKDFRPIREVEYVDIVAANRVFKDFAFTIVCMNPQNKLQSFKDTDRYMLEVFAHLCCASNVMHGFIRNKESTELDNLTYQNAFDVFKTVLLKDKQLQALLGVFCEMINAHSYCVIEKSKTKKTFSILLSSQTVKLSPPIGLDDVLSAMILSQPSSHIIVEKIQETNLKDSKFVEIFKPFENLIVSPLLSDRTYFIIFAFSENIVSNFRVLYDVYTPMISVLFNTYLETNHTQMIRRANGLNTDEISQYDSELMSKAFVIEKFSDDQIIEILLRVFESLDINNVLCSETAKIVKFIEKIRKNYNKHQFHNWNHAIETVQLCFYIIKKAKMTRIFSPMNLTAIIFACLMHDLQHDGTCNEYHTKAKTHLFHVFQNNPLLEMQSLTASARILKSAPFFVCINNDDFFKFFKECILATDVSKHSDIVSGYFSIAKSFESKNQLHQLALARLLISVCNISNVVRPFSHAEQRAEQLETEMDIVNEKLKKLNIKEPIKMFNECDCDDLPNIELKFIENVASPLIKTLAGSFPEVNDLSVALEDTKKNWQQIIENLK